MRTILLRIAYNGARYHGYQVQANAKTVAGTFQPVLEQVLNEKVQLKGCSRTDTGVHASDFGVSFQTNSTISHRGADTGAEYQSPAGYCGQKLRGPGGGLPRPVQLHRQALCLPGAG